MKVLRKINEVIPIYFIVLFLLIGAAVLVWRLGVTYLSVEAKAWVVHGMLATVFLVTTIVAYVFRYR